MKRLTILLIMSVIFGGIYAQKSPDTIDLGVKNIKLELLKSPTNPAFLIMNTSPTEIVEPGSSPEFFTSIQNASNNFTAIPNNFGFSITPYWWTKKAKRLSFNTAFDTINSFTFFRTTCISAGIIRGINDEEKLWRYGVGFKSALLQGKISETKRNDFIDKFREYHETYYHDINAYFRDYPEYNSIESERVAVNMEVESIDKLLEEKRIDSALALKKKKELIFKLSKIQNHQDSLRIVLSQRFNEEKKYVESNAEIDKKFNEMSSRTGFKWDIGGGISINSQDNKIDSTNLYRAGIWSNFGGDLISSDSSSSNLAAFALVRYLYYNEINYMYQDKVELINNLNTLDLGVKLQCEIDNKFSMGLEAIYRLGISNSIYSSTYKINGLLQYRLQNNKMIYASIGNNFNDNSNFRPNALVVTVGFNIGFGGNVDLYGIKL